MYIGMDYCSFQCKNNEKNLKDNKIIEKETIV